MTTGHISKQFGSIDGNILKGTHTTPKAGYTDDLEFKFYPNTASGGCNLVVSPYHNL